MVQELDAPTVLPPSAAADDGSLASLKTVPDGAIMFPTFDPDGTEHDPTRINFQPATTEIPAGFLADKSKTFGVRTSGLSYGWVAGPNAAIRDDPIIRHFMPLPQYDTILTLGEYPALGNVSADGWTWQITMPPGSYPLAVVLGDATSQAHTFNVTIQGETFTDRVYDPNANPGYEQGRFVGYSKQVTVGANGLLTITAASGALAPTLAFLELGVQGTQLDAAAKQRLADGVTHANARTGGSPFWNGGRTETRTYVWGTGIDELVAYQRTNTAGTQTYYVHTNNQGSVMAVTDSGGNVVERRQYGPYGELSLDHADSYGRSVIGLTTGWMGRALDDETGLMYFRYRYFSPHLGVWLSPDPLGYLGGMNLYQFVNGNPSNGLDPFGLIDEWHHLLPKEFKDFWKKIGVKLNSAEFGITLDDKLHDALHSAGWNDEWRTFLASGECHTAEDVMKKLQQMKLDSRFSGILSKGTAATVSYWGWRSKGLASKLTGGAARALVLVAGAAAVMDAADPDRLDKIYKDIMNLGAADGNEKLGWAQDFASNFDALDPMSGIISQPQIVKSIMNAE